MPEPRSPRPSAGAGRPAPRPAGSRPPGARSVGHPDGMADSPRGEFVPAKKKGAPPALTIGLLVACVVAAVVFVVVLVREKNQPAPPAKVVETSNVDEWAGIKEKIREARKRFEETMSLRTDEEQAALFLTKIEETTSYITGVREEIDAMLEPVRDKETGLLPPEYNGYNHDAKDLGTMIYDLSKATPFGVKP